MDYLFGDSDLAAERLAFVADTFAATSRAFLRTGVSEAPRLAVELGCGPGRTTHLLAEALGCEAAVGLDRSEHLIGIAGRTATAVVSFRRHDVTVLPFPVGPCDCIYGRFLLAHQAAAESLPGKWATQLRPGGRLLLEEPEAIHTRHPTFAMYLEIVTALLAHAGQDLYVGARLDAIKSPPGFPRLSSAVTRLQVPTDRAARMFWMNIRTWKECPFVKENFEPASIRRMEGELAELARGPGDGAGAEWRLRQIVHERSP